MVNKASGIRNYGKGKRGDVEPISQEEVAAIRNQYTKDSIFYTEPIEEPILVNEL